MSNEEDPLERARGLMALSMGAGDLAVSRCLQAIALALIDQAETARATLQHILERDSAPPAGLGSLLEMMRPVAERAREPQGFPGFAGTVINSPGLCAMLSDLMSNIMSGPGHAESAPPVTSSAEVEATPELQRECRRIGCSHRVSLHVQGEGPCLIAECDCDEFSEALP
jgi:hypothetical protein